MSVEDRISAGQAGSHESSGDSTAVGSASVSSSHLGKHEVLQNRLSVPLNHLRRRPSNESLFSGSDISELSFASTQIDHVENEGLIRHVSASLADFARPSTWREKVGELWFANYGAFLVLVSQLFGCTMNIATRLLETPGQHGPPMHPFQILFARQSITVLITTCYALWTKSVPHFPLGPPGRVRLLLVARGLFGFFGVFGIYFSLLYLPISEATVLTFLGPIGCCYAFSLLIPGETFSRQQQIAGFVSLSGVIFIARPFSLFDGGHGGTSENVDTGNSTMMVTRQEPLPPPTSAQHLQAIGVAMIGVVGGIGALTAIRSIGTRAHALLSVNYFSACCTFISLAALVIVPSVKFRMPGNAMEWGLLLLLGTAGFIMQLLLTKGMAYGTASQAERVTELDSQDDVEMQSREPQASASTAASASATDAKHSKTETQTLIKGSGVKATSMLYTQMLFALISDKVIFGVTPDLWSWVGSGLILSGAIWVAADSGKSSTAPKAMHADPHIGAASSIEAQKTGQEEQVGLLADAEDIDHIDNTTASPRR